MFDVDAQPRQGCGHVIYMQNGQLMTKKDALTLNHTMHVVMHAHELINAHLPHPLIYIFFLDH